MILLAALTLALTSCVLPTQAVDLEGQLWEQMGTSALEDAAEGTFSVKEGTNLQKGLGVLASQASEQVDAVLHSAFRSAGFMLLVVLFCGVGSTLFQSGQSAMTRTADLIGVTVITLVAVSDTASMLGLGREAIDQIDAFSKVLIPTMATATAACGSVTGAVVRQAATLLFSDLLITLINRVLIPLVYLYIAVTAATAALGSKGIAAIAGFMKKGVKGVMTAILLVFTGYLTLSGAAAGAADATALKATRMAISSMVPVVGGILSDATETVLTGASAIRSGIGIFGTLVILGFCVVPFLYLGVQYLVYKLVAMLASVLYQGTISDLIDQIGAAFGLVLGMLGSCALLVLLSLIGTIWVDMKRWTVCGIGSWAWWRWAWWCRSA